MHHALNAITSLLINSECDGLTWELGIALRDITTLALSTLVNGTGRRSAQHGAAWETKALYEYELLVAPAYPGVLLPPLNPASQDAEARLIAS